VANVAQRGATWRNVTLPNISTKPHIRHANFSVYVAHFPISFQKSVTHSSTGILYQFRLFDV
jgi:hypothetical protein